MGWTNPSSHVYATGEVVTASTLNTYIKDNLLDLDRRETLVHAKVDTAEVSLTTTYADLTTPGPTVTVTTGTQAVVIVQCQCLIGTATNAAIMGVVVSGATTIATTDILVLPLTQTTYSETGYGVWVPTLTAGSNTFKVQYKQTNGAGTYSFRRISVLPLLSA